MSDSVGVSEIAEHPQAGMHSTAPMWTRYWPTALAYGLILVLALLALTWFRATDYLGPDNDDALRLVEVRDLLNGQGWFDMMQYRLGLAGGTLMHWSRFVDLPIASLISFFSLFLGHEHAEVVAVAVWPLSLAIALQFAVGLAALRAGGIRAMHAALLLNVFLTIVPGRFRPGAIDHHNVQLVLVALIAAMLLDKKRGAGSYFAAGASAAMAIAIGAETTPFIAAACIIVGLQWLWHAERMAAAAQSFGLSLALMISAAFFLTVPSARYSVVTCDNLSLGFYALASVGGALLFVCARFASNTGLVVRAGALACIGAAVGATAIMVAPECLHNPLADLDPLLVKLWLHNVTEAQSFLSEVGYKPVTIGVFYAVPVFAVAVCIARMVRRDRIELHLTMLGFVLVNLVIGCIQIRSMIFANLLSVLPMSVLAAEMHARTRREPQNVGLGAAFVATVLLSASSTWAIAEPIFSKFVRVNSSVEADESTEPGCRTREEMHQLASLPPGVVAGPSNMGAPILRFTDHRVLAAPYHRNVGGMLTELHIGLAQPKEAEAFLRGADVSIVAFCPSDPQTELLTKMKPDGLYAALGKGSVPSYLKALPADPKSGIHIFEVRPTP